MVHLVSHLNFLLIIHLSFFTEARASSMPVRLLPFSLVPGITINSPLFLKAVSIVTKQAEAATTVNRTLDPQPAALPKGKKKRAPAGKHIPISQLHCLNLFYQTLCPKFSMALTRTL
jgi:hypothetical protein